MWQSNGDLDGLGRFSPPLIYVSRTEISCTSPQCGHLTLPSKRLEGFAHRSRCRWALAGVLSDR
jgi:hypothetical protein